MENSWGLSSWKSRKGFWWMWSHSWSRSLRIEGDMKKSWGLSPCGKGRILEKRVREAICEGLAQVQWQSQHSGDSGTMGQPPKSAPAMEWNRNAVDNKDRNLELMRKSLGAQKIEGESEKHHTELCTVRLWFCFHLNVTVPCFFPFGQESK